MEDLDMNADSLFAWPSANLACLAGLSRSHPPSGSPYHPQSGAGF